MLTPSRARVPSRSYHCSQLVESRAGFGSSMVSIDPAQLDGQPPGKRHDIAHRLRAAGTDVRAAGGSNSGAIVDGQRDPRQCFETRNSGTP